MLLRTTEQEILAALSEPRVVQNDTFIPAQAPAANNCPYLPEYEWLFVFERQLARALGQWLAAHRFELIGSRGLLSEALSNAYCHGNRRNPKRPIEVKTHVGTSGLLTQVRDQGPGFAVDEVCEQVLRGRRLYFHNAGNGLRRMAAHRLFGVFHADGGRTCNLVLFFEHQGELLAGFAR